MPKRRRSISASVPALEVLAERLEELLRIVYDEMAVAGSQVPEPRQRGPAVLLTAREREVLRHMQFRRTDAEIASRLGLSTKTIARHASRLYRKLGVHSRGEAVDRYRDLVASRGETAEEGDISTLSGRELDVLRAMDAGKSVEEIAAALRISTKTVTTHAHSLYRKLGVDSRGEAVDRYRSRRA